MIDKSTTQLKKTKQEIGSKVEVNWKLTSPPPLMDQVKILHPSAEFKINLLSAACKMLYSDYSDWLKIPNLEPS